jgi:hypothetical protein
MPPPPPLPRDGDPPWGPLMRVPAYEWAERRIIPRHYILMVGRITLDKGVFVDCQVRNFSPAGAGLWLKNAISLPVHFDLNFDNLTRRCVVVWRRPLTRKVADRLRAISPGPDSERARTQARALSLKTLKFVAGDRMDSGHACPLGSHQSESPTLKHEAARPLFRVRRRPDVSKPWSRSALNPAGTCWDRLNAECVNEYPGRATAKLTRGKAID